MKLDFEKFLNENGLKVGDKVRIFNGVCEIIKRENGIFLEKENEPLETYSISNLQFNFEKIEPKKKVGDLLCYDIAEPRRCTKCPLQCITCGGYTHETLREILEATLKEYPQLEPMRPYIEKELDKEIEE